MTVGKAAAVFTSPLYSPLRFHTFLGMAEETNDE
jgi:hypothetical protein